MVTTVTGRSATSSAALSPRSLRATSASLTRNGAPAALATNNSPISNGGSRDTTRSTPSASNGTRTKFATSADTSDLTSRSRSTTSPTALLSPTESIDATENTSTDTVSRESSTSVTAPSR